MNPPQRSLPIIERLVGVYKLWHEWLPHLPKVPRYNIGRKIDRAMLATTEAVFLTLVSPVEKKVLYLRATSSRLELTKFLLQIAWEIRALDNKKYGTLSEQLNEAGRMIGGWLRKLEKETPTNSRREK